LPSSYSVEYEDGFTFLKPQSIECRIVTCKNYDVCSQVGEKSGILPKAKSILESLGLDWRLPGYGKQYNDCGDWRARGCLNVGDHVQSELDQETKNKIYVEYYHRSCYRAECPVCYEKWAGKEASKIEHRLKHLWKHGKVLHVTVSPSEKDVLNIPFEKLRQKAYRIAKNRGIIGGSMIWHPFRERDNGTWYFSPHFHILGFGWVQNVAESFKKDGWLVKNIQEGKEERSIFRTAMYQLSHCGIDANKKHRPVSWFGVCSSAGKNHAFVPPMEKEKHICPCCKAELIQLRYFGDPDKLPFSPSQKLDREGGWWLDPEGWVEIQQSTYGDH
jgi:hypothetical protein